MSKGNSVIDARDKFHAKVEYKVQIEVKVNVGFLWAIAKCLWKRKDLKITHTFTNDPLLKPDLNING